MHFESVLALNCPFDFVWFGFHRSVGPLRHEFVREYGIQMMQHPALWEVRTAPGNGHFLFFNNSISNFLLTAAAAYQP